MSWNRRWVVTGLLTLLALGGVLALSEVLLRIEVKLKGSADGHSSAPSVADAAGTGDRLPPVDSQTEAPPPLDPQAALAVREVVRAGVPPLADPGIIPVSETASPSEKPPTLPTPPLPEPSSPVPPGPAEPPLVPAPALPEPAHPGRLPPPSVALPQAAPPAGPTPAPPPGPVPCPWALRMEIVEGRAQLEARSGDEVLFRINCARLDLQAPHGQLQAQGTVQISGAGLEATCERLIISWQDDKVLLEGQVRLKCHKGGPAIELAGHQLSVKLNTVAPVKTTDAASTPLGPMKPAPID